MIAATMNRHLSRRDTTLSGESRYESADESVQEEETVQGDSTPRKRLSRKNSIAKLFRQASHASINAYQGAIKALSGNAFNNQRRRSSVRRKWGVDRSLIEAVRQRIIFLMEQEAAQKSDSKDILIHPKDALYIRETDDMIVRFLMEFFEDHPMGDKDFDEANLVKTVSNQILDTLHWRMEVKVNELKDSDFPREFYTCGIYGFGDDSDGSCVLYIKGRKYKKVSSVWTPLFISFFVHESEKKILETFGDPMCPKNPTHKPAIVVDTTGCGLGNVDLDMAFAFIPLIKHYPQCFSYCWIYEMPWMLRPFFNLTTKLLPSRIMRRVKLMDKKSAINEMGLEGLPKFMGGTNPIEPTMTVPETVSTIEEVAQKRGIPDNEVKKMKAYMEWLIEDARKEAKK